jgi:hypothetical protein
MGYAAHALVLHKTVYGDGIFYYSWLRSAVIDHDVSFKSDYAYFHTSQPATPLHIQGNKYTVGPALLWAPWFLLTNEIVRGTGYEFPYQFIVGLSSVFYAFIGLLLLYRLLGNYFGKTATMATLIGIALATNLFFYGSLDAVNSHAVSFFAASFFITLVLASRKNWFFIGCALGLIALIRTQDIILGLLALPYIKPKNILYFLSGAFVLFLPQLVGWQLVNGNFWHSPYLSSFEGFDFIHPNIIGVLFSLQNGLLLWTPIIILGFIGLLKKKTELPLKLMAAIILVQLYLVASWSTWWQGASYSGRMFVSILPLIAFGLANFFSFFESPRFRYTTVMYAITLPLSIINFLLMFYFLLIH